jgi:hypothetical protein
LRRHLKLVTAVRNKPEPPIGHYRPKAQLFGVLSVLWLFPSLGALLILVLRAGVWVHAESFRAGLSATRFEQWVALLILLLHLTFHGLARYYRKNEVPRELPPDDAD